MLSPRGKKELKINQRRILINSIEIGIPAPEQVFILGQRHTSNGKVVGRVRNSKTLNYKSFTPHRDGLFCERIFGPVQSYICACGKQGPLTTGKGTLKFCPRCEVEYTDQRARRYRIGYIGLVSPVTHIWHLKGRPSYLSLFLGKRKKTLATLAYCNDYLVEQAFSKVDVNGVLSSSEQHSAIGADFFKNRILKGLKESKVIKGLTLSREQEKSKVWSPETDFIDGPLVNRIVPKAETTFWPLLPTLRSKVSKSSAPKGPKRLPSATQDLRSTWTDRAITTTNRAPAHLRAVNRSNAKRARIEFTKSSDRLEAIDDVKKYDNQERLEVALADLRSLAMADRPKRGALAPTGGSWLCASALTRPMGASALTRPTGASAPRSYAPRAQNLPTLRSKVSKLAKFDKQNGNRANFLNYLRSTKKSTTPLSSSPRRLLALGPPSGGLEQDLTFAHFATQSGQKLPEHSSGRQVKQEASQKKATLSYTRSQTLPFLPTFICEFHLRDGLLSFFDTFPPTEDIPIPVYCKIPRRYPLRDVHKFMADQAFSKVQVEQSSTKGFDNLRSKLWARGALEGGGLTQSLYRSKVQLLPTLLRKVSKSSRSNNTLAAKPPLGSLSTASFTSKTGVIGGSGQLCLPIREVGLINGKDVPHISIGTVNEKRLSLREVLLTLLLGRIVTTLIGLTPSLATYLNRPEPAISKPNILVGAESTVVMARRVGSQVTARPADETGTFDAPSVQAGSTRWQSDARNTSRNPAKGKVKGASAPHSGFDRALGGAPSKTEGFVMASNVWTPEVRSGNFCSAKVRSCSKPPEGGARPRRRSAEYEQAKGEPRVIGNSIGVFERSPDKSASAPRSASTKAGGDALLLSRRGLVSTQNKSSYLKRKIVSEVLLFKHPKGRGLPVIGESPARLTIRLAFADGWSDVAPSGPSKAWLASPYQSSRGYRLTNFCYAKVAGAATGDQSLECGALAPYHRRDLVGETRNPRLEHTSNQDYFEDSFFSLRSGFLQSKTKPGSLRFGESVEDWLEYWFDGWLQNCYGVKRGALAPATGFAFVRSLGPFEAELLRSKSCRNYVPTISQSQTLLRKVAKFCPTSWGWGPKGFRALRALEQARQRKAKSRPPALARLAMSARAEGLTKPKARKGLSLRSLLAGRRRGLAPPSGGLEHNRTFAEQKLPERASSRPLRGLERPTVLGCLSSPSQVGEHIWFVRKRNSNLVLLRKSWRTFAHFATQSEQKLLRGLESSYRPAAGAAPGGQSHSVATKAERSLLAFLFKQRDRVNLRKPKKSDNLQQKRRFCLENGFSFSVFIFMQKVARYEDRVLQLFTKTTPDSSQLSLVGPLNITLVRASLALKHSLVRFAQSESNDRIARATDFNRVRSRTINKSASAPRSAKINENQIKTKRATGVGPKHNLASYLTKHEQRVKWVKREVFSYDINQGRGISRPGGCAQPGSSGTGLWPVRPSVLLDACSDNRQRGFCSASLSTSKRRRPVLFATSIFLILSNAKFGGEENLSRVSDTRIGGFGAGAPCSTDRKNGTSIAGTTFRQLLPTLRSKVSKSSAPSGPKSVRNLESHVWFPEIVTIFKIMRSVPDLLLAKRGALAQPHKKPSWRSAEPSDAETTFRLPPKGPKNKNLIFSDAHNAKDYRTDATLFSESEAPTSKSIKDDISVGGTSPERSYGLPCSGEGGARRSLKTEVERAERGALAPLTNPRFVLAGLAWARRALEKYRDAGLRASLTRRRQLNQSASAPRSAVVPAIALENQAQEGRTKPDLFVANDDEYGDEEGPVSAIDDKPEINRVGGRLVGFTEGEPFRTDSYSAQLSKAQPLRVEHNATALEAGKGGTDSYVKAQMDLQAIQEVLSYTGGGALRELLRCFDTQAFSAILLNEIKLLREYHKGYFLYEYDQISGKAMLGVTRGQPEPRRRPVKWTERPKTLLDRSLLSEPDQLLPSHRGFVKPAWSSKAKQLEIDNQAEYENNYEELPEEINRFSRAIHRNARRLKIVQLLMRNKRRPEWMLISALPVLPPDLRPILQMSENLIVASDLNTLYQRVIYRNNRQYKLRIVEWSYATSLQRLVQDAVDRLIENGKGGSKPFLTPGGRPLKSLSDTLKGKKGRFRLNLLGKRVDFSGRSVIVVSPHLKIHECGLPREMALELYQYLLIRQMLLKRQVSSVILAKRVIREQKDFVWDTLRELIYHHPLLLNRAPTLHRLGIQAFQPKLVLGSTILLHPLVCAGFNADFDGDQMGVHLPLCDEARAEAWDLLWSRNNLLSPATGEPILLPSQDMVLGFYHMTALLPFRYANSIAPAAGSVRSIARGADKAGRRRGFGFVQIDAKLPAAGAAQVRTSVLFEKGFRKSHFFSPLDVVRAYQNGDLDIHTPIWLQWNGKIENNDSDQIPLEVRITSFGVSTQLYPSYKYRKDATSKLTATFNLFIRTTPGRVIVNNIFLAPTGQTE